jgi:hypothetical protein
MRKATSHYAKHKLTNQTAYMQHAGCLSKEESQQMLKVTERERKNKKLKLDNWR